MKLIFGIAMLLVVTVATAYAQRTCTTTCIGNTCTTTCF